MCVHKPRTHPCAGFVGMKRKKKVMKLSSASLESKNSLIHLQPSVSSADCHTADWGDNRHINCKHIIWSIAGQSMPPPPDWCSSYYFQRPRRHKNLVVANKNVMQETILKIERTTAEDLFCTSNNRHLKTDGQLWGEHRHVPSSPTQIFTQLHGNQSLRQMFAHKLTHHLLTLTSLSALWWHHSHSPCFTAPAHAEISAQRVVKGVCAQSLGSIKDGEGLKRIKAGAIQPRLFLRLHLPLG